MLLTQLGGIHRNLSLLQLKMKAGDRVEHLQDVRRPEQSILRLI
jgi:hypothetical protein